MTRELKLKERMIAYENGSPARIQHFMKVYAFADMIGEAEKLSEEKMEILRAAALVHDIGIRVAEEKYGSCGGKLQEKEGPAIAKKLLSKLGFDTEISDRVQYLIAHHHTYDDINGIDYQILVEADFLVNMMEDNLPKQAVENAYNKIFSTSCGKRICKNMFGL